MTALLVVAAVSVTAMLVLASALHATIRRHGREREKLINQICHLAGKPWQPAPASEPPPVIEDPDRDRYIYAPDQLPDEYS
jgi:hypothetical protein